MRGQKSCEARRTSSRRTGRVVGVGEALFCRVVLSFPALSFPCVFERQTTRHPSPRANHQYKRRDWVCDLGYGARGGGLCAVCCFVVVKLYLACLRGPPSLPSCLPIVVVSSTKCLPSEKKTSWCHYSVGSWPVTASPVTPSLFLFLRHAQHHNPDSTTQDRRGTRRKQRRQERLWQ